MDFSIARLITPWKSMGQGQCIKPILLQAEVPWVQYQYQCLFMVSPCSGSSFSEMIAFTKMIFCRFPSLHSLQHCCSQIHVVYPANGSSSLYHYRDPKVTEVIWLHYSLICEISDNVPWARTTRRGYSSLLLA